jgi:hypothetical protein
MARPAKPSLVTGSELHIDIPIPSVGFGFKGSIKVPSHWRGVCSIGLSDIPEPSGVIKGLALGQTVVHVVPWLVLPPPWVPASVVRSDLSNCHGVPITLGRLCDLPWSGWVWSVTWNLFYIVSVSDRGTDQIFRGVGRSGWEWSVSPFY